MNLDYSSHNAEPYTYAQYVTAVEALGPGDYIVRVSVAGADNYRALTQDMSLTISRYNSKFTAIPAKLTGKWGRDENKNTATVLDDATITAYSYIPDADGDTLIAALDIEYTLSGVTYDSFAKLKAAVKSLGRDSYQVRVTVAQTDENEGLSATLQLDIAAGDNSWFIGEGSPAPTQSIVVSGGSTPVTQWAWNTEIDWLGVKPLYGDTVVIRIVAASDENNVLKYFTVNVGDGFDTHRGLVSAYVSKLDVGSYIMIVTTPAGGDWSGIGDVTATGGTAYDGDPATATRIPFKIITAENAWKTAAENEGVDGRPHFTGRDVTLTDGKYKWTYDAMVNVIAAARHGAVSVVYKDANGNTYGALPANAGTYTAVFTVPAPATGNYAAIAGTDAVTLTFIIEGRLYEGFVVSPGVHGWVWDSYDASLNLFMGKPTSGGAVHFAVEDADGNVIIDKFELVNDKGVHVGDFDKDVYAPSGVVTKLNALNKGTYTLRVYVAAKDNYEAFDASATFNVTEATNTWDETPKIASWFRGGWKESQNAPVAVSRYGAPVIVIKSNASGDVIYRAVYNELTKEYDVSLNKLESADAGWYTMTVSVDGSEGQYTSLPTAEVQFQVFIQGSPDDKNFWEITPGIEGWTATTDGRVVMPSGKPVRGKPYFVFYRAELVGDEYKLIGKVEEGEDALTVKKGDDYAQDFYVPMAPGTYFMYAYATNAAVPADALGEDDSSRVMLIIRNRANSWERAVSIPSIMYLGDRANWADPTAKASLPGEITYKYYDAATRAYIGKVKPVTAGKYVVVAYADAKYSQTIESEAEFEIMLSKNYWVGDKSPTIGGWSEEFSADSPDPVGEAAFGTIVYTYINKAEPGVEHAEKPIAAGDYIMIARVVLDGYETLEAPYEFTIEPAFDSMLVTIDIILGVVACMLAIVVIVFAIRRYKENG